MLKSWVDNTEEMFRETPVPLISKLIETAFFLGHMVGSPEPHVVWAAKRDGKEIPERCRPGYIILNLPEEQRDRLKSLTSDELNKNIDKYKVGLIPPRSGYRSW